MNFGIAIITLIPVILVGDLIHRAIYKNSGEQLEISHRWPLALAFGMGAVTLLLFYTSLINTRMAFTVTLGILVLVSVVYLIVSAPGGLSGVQGAARRRTTFLLLLGGALLVAILWYVSREAGPGYDSYAHWGIKAKASFLDGGWNLTREGLRRFSHPAYPLLVPSLQAWVYTVLGEVNEGAVKIVFILMYLSLGGLFYFAVRRLFSRLLAIFFTLLMMSTPLLAISTLAAYADVPLMFFLFGSVLFLTNWLDDRRWEDLLIGAVLAGLMLLVKREAVVYWVVIFVFIAGYYFLSRKTSRSSISSRQMLVFPAAAVLIAGSWFLLLQITEVEQGSFESPSLDLLFDRSARLAVIARSLFRELFLNFGAWGILWYLFVGTTIWKWRRLSSPSVLLPWISVVFPVLLLNLSFVFSTWDEYTLHIDTALSRLILHVVPLAWLFIAKQGFELQGWFNELKAGASNDSVSNE